MSTRTGWVLLILSMTVLVAALLLRRAGILGTNHVFAISIVAALVALVGRTMVARGQR